MPQPCQTAAPFWIQALSFWIGFPYERPGPFLLMQGVVRHLIETGQPGSIVNILSMVVHCGQSYLAAYSASKGALATLTKNVANAFAANRIRCNGILTGWMDTPGESATQQKFHGSVEIGSRKLRLRSPWDSWLSRIK